MGWFDLRRVWPVLVAAALTTTVQVFVMASSLSRPAAMFGSALDYRISVWGPLRGLAAGLNPYDPGNVAYHDSISDAAAALHLPAVLVLSAPTAVFDLNTGYLIFAVASCLMMWLAAVILFAPQDRRSVCAAIVGGVLLTVSGPGEEVLRLGQLTAFVVLGLALVIRYPRSWVGAVGFALVLICPQFAIVLAIFLVGLRRWTDVWKGSVVAVVVSLPVVVVAMVEAGSPNDFISGVLRNLQLAGGVGNATNRMDLPGRYSQGSVLWSVVAIVVVCGLSWAAHSRRITPNPELWLGVVAVGLIAAFSMPYYLPLAVLVGTVVLFDAASWIALRWLSAVMVGITVPAALWILVPLADLIGIPVARYWGLLTYAEGLLLTIIVVVVCWRLTRSPAGELAVS